MEELSPKRINVSSFRHKNLDSNYRLRFLITFNKIFAGVVYGVCNEDSAWPYRKEREASEEIYFGLKTAQGLLEFKSESKLHKQKWVDGIEFLLGHANSAETTEKSMNLLNISSST